MPWEPALPLSRLMALAGIESKIPVDEVIDAVAQVGSSLPTAFRETAEVDLQPLRLVVATKKSSGE